MIMNTNTKTKITECDLPWVEKYRPEKIENIIGNDNIKESLICYLKNKHLPHLILYGPSGIGKTSIINSFAKELYNKHYNLMVLQINASEERGIEIIRNKVKNFIISKCLYDFEFKLVILDEADSMTFSAQSMLRRIIEDYTENARFCLICNKIKNIDPAIKSRCTLFKFNGMSNKNMKTAIINICKNNNIKYTLDGIDFLINISKGDMRKMINNLQSITMVYDNITYDNVAKFTGYPSINNIEYIFKISNLNKYEKSVKIIEELINNNHYSLLELITETHKYILDQFIINNIKIEKFMNIINKLKKIENSLYTCPNDSIGIASYVGCFY
jgi:replication factor C subunit 3/5